MLFGSGVVARRLCNLLNRPQAVSGLTDRGEWTNAQVLVRNQRPAAASRCESCLVLAGKSVLISSRGFRVKSKLIPHNIPCHDVPLSIRPNSQRSKCEGGRAQREPTKIHWWSGILHGKVGDVRGYVCPGGQTDGTAGEVKTYL